MTAVHRPRLKPHIFVDVVVGEGVYFLDERNRLRLSEVVFSAVVPLLDGSNTVEEIFAALRGEYDVHEVFGALSELRSRSLLVEGLDDGGDLPIEAVAFWDTYERSAGCAATRLAAARVRVDVCGREDASPWRQAFAEAGIASDEATGLQVVLADDYLDPALAEIDQDRRAQRQPWVLARPRGQSLWLGPLFVPGQTGCWHCLAQRLRGHRRLRTHLQSKPGHRRVPPLAVASVPSTTRAAQGLLATELSTYFATGDCVLRGAVQTLAWRGLKAERHPLLRRPQCPACGTPPAIDRVVRVHLPPSTETVRVNDAGSRLCSPEATIERLSDHVSPITGIIGHLDVRRANHADVTPLFVTDHSFVDMDRELYFLQEGFRKRSGGKGTTVAQAKASALGESIERYCGVFVGDEPRRTATLAELGTAGIHPNAVMGYSDRQYERRHEHNAHDSRVRWVPEPFAAQRAVEWTPLWSLAHDAPRYLPTACCYYGYRDAQSEAPRFAVADSNGCAAGNTLAEATLQGLYELIERDCVAMWWYARVPRPGIDLSALGEPYIDRLIAHYRDILDRDLWALELTNDLAIPTVAAISRRRSGPREDIILGFGAHSDPRIAMLRAVTELNQSLPSVPGPGDDPSLGRGSNHDATHWWTHATTASETYLLPTKGLRPSERWLRPRPSSGGLGPAEQVSAIVGTLSERGLDTLVLDQSRPDAGLAVARVVVPGLRHFWPRFGAGRLYDVPTSIGWLDRSPTEDELNPYVVYF